MPPKTKPAAKKPAANKTPQPPEEQDPTPLFLACQKGDVDAAQRCWKKAPRSTGNEWGGRSSMYKTATSTWRGCCWTKRGGRSGNGGGRTPLWPPALRPRRRCCCWTTAQVDVRKERWTPLYAPARKKRRRARCWQKVRRSMGVGAVTPLQARAEWLRRCGALLLENPEVDRPVSRDIVGRDAAVHRLPGRATSTRRGCCWTTARRLGE